MRHFTRPSRVAASLVVSASLASMTQAASAAPVAVDHLATAKVFTVQAAPGAVEQVYWRGRGWGWGVPVAGGLIAGAIIGGALAAPYYGGGYYYPGPYYGGPAPAYYDAPPPAYAAPPPGDADEAYCVRRYRSYDPASGTFLGNDGHRHPCP